MRGRGDRGRRRADRLCPCRAIKAWAERLKTYAAGGAPDDLAPVDRARTPPKTARDVFAFLVIHEGKVRAPAGAQALIAALATQESPLRLRPAYAADQDHSGRACRT